MPDDAVSKVLNSFPRPVLVVTTLAGKGIYTIGEALCERFSSTDEVYHLSIEEMLPDRALAEDYKRYNFISNNFPILLNLPYRIPFFYYRKLFREKYFSLADLSKLKAVVLEKGIQTVICASHRPAFWFSYLKLREKMSFTLWGMLSEFGRSLGWKYIFWEAMDGFFSPVEQNTLDFPFPRLLRYVKAQPPCKREYYTLAESRGLKNNVLLVAGHWGQIFPNNARTILDSLLKKFPLMTIYVVCGKNQRLYEDHLIHYKNNKRIVLYGEIPSLVDVMGPCASVITKPGISTLLEAYAAKRKIFLLRGMPVAEDNNALYAINNFNAEWFSVNAFADWYNS